MVLSNRRRWRAVPFWIISPIYSRGQWLNRYVYYFNFLRRFIRNEYSRCYETDTGFAADKDT